jgi:hypothetical protein
VAAEGGLQSARGFLALLLDLIYGAEAPRGMNPALQPGQDTSFLLLNN